MIFYGLVRDTVRLSKSGQSVLFGQRFTFSQIQNNFFLLVLLLEKHFVKSSSCLSGSDCTIHRSYSNFYLFNFCNMLKLTREQKNAIQVYLDHESTLEKLIPFTEMLHKDSTLLPTNFVAFSYLPILKSSIPKEKTWSWNQSNIKIDVTINQNTTISLKKLSPRKLSAGSGCNPSFKIWLYEIIKNNNTQYFIWCEKGLHLDEKQSLEGGLLTPIGTIFPQKLSLQSFSFLKDFVEDRNLIAEFGWS